MLLFKSSAITYAIQNQVGAPKTCPFTSNVQREKKIIVVV